MATGSSTYCLRHWSSHGLGQIRPMTPRKRKPFFDHLNTFPIIPQGNLADILFDINAGRAGPLAGRCTVFQRIFSQNSSGNRRKVDNVFWTDSLTGPAAGTFFFINYRQSIGSHGEGVKWTGSGAGSKPKASDGADLHASAQHSRSPAVIQPVIYILKIRVLDTVSTSRPGNIRLFGFNQNA